MTPIPSSTISSMSSSKSVSLGHQAEHLPPFSDFLGIVLQNPTSIDFVQGLGNAGLTPDKIKTLRDEAHERARAHRPEKEVTAEELGLPEAAKPSAGAEEKPCPSACAENRVLMKQRYEQSRREAAALRDRVAKLKEDGEDAKRIANELDAEVKATQESGQSIKVEILMQHRREEQLTAFIKSAVDEKADMAARMAKLERELQKRRRELNDLEAQIRALIWSSTKGDPGGGSSNQSTHGQTQRLSLTGPLPVELVFASPSTATTKLHPRRAQTAGSNHSSGNGNGRGQRRRFFSDATRPLSRRYMGLAQEGTADVMELWQALQLASGSSTHGSSEARTAKPWTCSAETRRSAGRGAARSASPFHARCGSPFALDPLDLTLLAPPHYSHGHASPQHHSTLPLSPSSHSSLGSHSSGSSLTSSSSLRLHQSSSLGSGADLSLSGGSRVRRSTLLTSQQQQGRWGSGWRKGGRRRQKQQLGVPTIVKLAPDPRQQTAGGGGGSKFGLAGQRGLVGGRPVTAA